MTKDDILKLKAVTLYILTECRGLDPLHLFKILYFADTAHLAKYGRRITNDVFCALPKGPVPSGLYDALKAIKGKRLSRKNANLQVITDALLSDEDTLLNYVIYPNEVADMDELSKSDIECITKSIEENYYLPFDELSNKSHALAWTVAHDTKPNSPIDVLLMAKEAGATDDMIEYIKEDIHLNSIIS